jgi:hypothetical protein
VLGLVAAGSLCIRDRSLRVWIASLLGAVAAVITLRSLSVFWHGVVISSLPETATRLAAAVAILGGVSAAVLGIAAADEGPRRREARR